MTKGVFTLFQMELKRGFFYLPRLLLGAIFLSLAIGGTSFFSARLLNQKAEKQKAAVAISVPEGDKGVAWMLSLLESMESVKDMISFSQTETEEEAIQMLQKGEASSAVLVPEGFLRGILSGSNEPARIILPDGAALASLLVKELTQAGADTLGAAQAGMYSVYEFYQRHGERARVPEVEEELNQIYLKTVLPRGDLFAHEKTSATGGLSAAAYFGISGVVLFLFLWGMACPELMRQRFAFCSRLAGIGVTKWHWVLIRTGVSFILLLATVLPVFALAVFALRLEVSVWRPMVVPFLLCAWGAAAYTVLLYGIGKNGISGALGLFITAIVMVFLAGGFVPSVFLPEAAEALGGVLPAGVLIGILQDGLSDGLDWKSVAAAVLLMAALYILAALVFSEGKGASEE